MVDEQHRGAALGQSAWEQLPPSADVTGTVLVEPLRGKGLRNAIDHDQAHLELRHSPSQSDAVGGGERARTGVVEPLHQVERVSPERHQAAQESPGCVLVVEVDHAGTRLELLAHSHPGVFRVQRVLHHAKKPKPTDPGDLAFDTAMKAARRALDRVAAELDELEEEKV